MKTSEKIVMGEMFLILGLGLICAHSAMDLMEKRITKLERLNNPRETYEKLVHMMSEQE